ncbi:anaerobic ribonucleoside-triphosphate reductase [Candidatus Micrarchaeota archaeon]|jgi:ribonucleoside-triphosphate reductase|nr:anaerobic ribonucleoside-triphosphate reductase [Candidatus Micrarchaeota archaeon]
MNEEEIKDLEKKRTKCLVYSRVVGYIRPVQQWNEGKQAEFNERRSFDESC